MSYLQITPALTQVPCTGGTTTHTLQAIGNERLAFKVKVKQKFYDQFRVTPALGFVNPGEKKELVLTRHPGKPGKTKFRIEYIAAPRGYDPRKPFIVGSEVGTVELRVIAYKDANEKVMDAPKFIAGKTVTKTGQKFTAADSGNEKEIEQELEKFAKDQEKCLEFLKKTLAEAGKKESSSEEESKNIAEKKKKAAVSAAAAAAEHAKLEEMRRDMISQNEAEIQLTKEKYQNEVRALQVKADHMKKEIEFLRNALLLKLEEKSEPSKILVTGGTGALKSRTGVSAVGTRTAIGAVGKVTAAGVSAASAAHFGKAIEGPPGTVVAAGAASPSAAISGKAAGAATPSAAVAGTAAPAGSSAEKESQQLGGSPVKAVTEEAVRNYIAALGGASADKVSKSGGVVPHELAARSFGTFGEFRLYGDGSGTSSGYALPYGGAGYGVGATGGGTAIREAYFGTGGATSTYTSGTGGSGSAGGAGTSGYTGGAGGGGSAGGAGAVGGGGGQGGGYGGKSTASVYL